MESMNFYDLLVMKLYRLIEEIEGAQKANIDEKLIISRCLYAFNLYIDQLNERAEQLK